MKTLRLKRTKRMRNCINRIIGKLLASLDGKLLFCSQTELAKLCHIEFSCGSMQSLGTFQMCNILEVTIRNWDRHAKTAMIGKSPFNINIIHETMPKDG